MSEEAPAGIRERLFVALQHVIPQHFLSHLVYRLARSRSPGLKNRLIQAFVRSYRPEMREAAEPDPLRYASFNDFFTRSLRAGSRPVDPAARSVVSPVDGLISQIGHLEESRIVQAKGHDYSVAELLGLEAGSSWPQRFAGGSFTTLYLAPFDYHRVHMPLEGTLRAAWYVPGRLFSVNAVTAASVPRLFARNERIICLFEGRTAPFAVVLVGALFVGSMSTVWHGEITPRSPPQRLDLPLQSTHAPLHLSKGAEMGRFNMGSTVILLLPPGASTWLPEWRSGERVLVGQVLAYLGA
ncbi:MAG TPA: archaetidylserine decarboxylase [Steroidobacteraceae bacterium]|nr:archaetidylserine decarboxylase [Steroidobacteraceae bacterium]